MSKIIVFATPVFLFLIAMECWIGMRRAKAGTGHNTYRLSDTINSISLGMLSQISGILSKLISVGIYAAVFNWIAPGEGMQAFWHSALGLILALLFSMALAVWASIG